MRAARSALVISILGLLFTSIGGSGASAAMRNDDINTPWRVSSLPFYLTEDTHSATYSSGEPADCTFAGSGNPHPYSTVWFSYTAPRAVTLDIATKASFSDLLAIYRGAPTIGNEVFCGGSYNNDVGGTFRATAGATYLIMIGADQIGGNVAITISKPGVPLNDAFANATTIGAAPFNDSIDLSNASVQRGEPTSSCESNLYTSAWYSFTAPASTTANVFVTAGGITLAAYAGSTMGGLQEVRCESGTPYDNQMSFPVSAGQTYRIQVSARSFETDPFAVQFTTGTTVDADFSSGLRRVTMSRRVLFDDRSFDPLAHSFASQTWDFGDGRTSTGSSALHSFATDGTYQVTHTVTTTDGRTGSTTRSVVVATHDPSIVSVDAPSSATAGSTVSVTVTVDAGVYPEDLLVTLAKRVGSGSNVRVGTARLSLTGSMQLTFHPTLGAADAGTVEFRARVRPRDDIDADPVNDLGEAQTTVS